MTFPIEIHPPPLYHPTYSDATLSTHPLPSKLLLSYTSPSIPPLSTWLSTLHLYSLPLHYSLYGHLRLDGSGCDHYLYGHPLGVYTNPIHFLPHLLWLVGKSRGESNSCGCCLCGSVLVKCVGYRSGEIVWSGECLYQVLSVASEFVLDQLTDTLTTSDTLALTDTLTTSDTQTILTDTQTILTDSSGNSTSVKWKSVVELIRYANSNSIDSNNPLYLLRPLPLSSFSLSVDSFPSIYSILPLSHLYSYLSRPITVSDTNTISNTATIQSISLSSTYYIPSITIVNASTNTITSADCITNVFRLGVECIRVGDVVVIGGRVGECLLVVESVGVDDKVVGSVWLDGKSIGRDRVDITLLKGKWREGVSRGMGVVERGEGYWIVDGREELDVLLQ